MPAPDPKLNLPARTTAAPAGDFALPAPAPAPCATASALPPAGAWENLAPPAGALAPADTGAARIANDFTITAPTAAGDALLALAPEAAPATPGGALDLPPRGLTF